MNLSICRRHVFKYRLPIDAPAGEDRIWVPCDSEKERQTAATRQAEIPAKILNSLVWSNMHDRRSRNLKSTISRQQWRVAACFWCRHFLQNSCKFMERQLSICSIPPVIKKLFTKSPLENPLPVFNM